MTEITLISADSEKFTVKARIFQDSVISGMLLTLGTTIPLDFDAATLKKVIEWCKYRYDYSQLDFGRLEKTSLAYYNKTKKFKDWEKNFLQMDNEMLLSIIAAADWFDIDALFQASCRRAATLLQNGSLNSVMNLAVNIQAQIAQNIPPNALKKLADAGNISLSPEQQLHNLIWTSFFSSDHWFEAIFALDYEINPILIGKSLGRGEEFVVLSSMDWNGDVWYDKRKLRDSLNSHRFDERTYESTIDGSEKVINIYESKRSDYSVVSGVEERLVQSEPDGTRWTSVSYLRKPGIFKHATRAKPNRRVEVLCEECPNPHNGKPLRWLCLDSTVTDYQPTSIFQNGLR
ncbi:hypothetical protein S7711_10237 [Stachybotrys chartarum IBT 7711]|uniref:SKP1 component POZ domain-containing protein n=1 Tax=Stachybotrys chartarum (strain CBS 109288 / IBT 7711) TaxID=1280523 RepID=A0A084B5Y9_STACB|nr:hypothetical protein S7711_10237 [Stachybotrys chartarum IBT 7711]